MVYLDNRHFVAGAEAAYPFDYMEDFPDAAHGLVGGLAMEHFGGVQFHEIGDDYKGTGWPAHTSVYTFPNPLAIETAIAVVKEVKQQRANVAAPPAAGLGNVYSKLGVNGQSQGFWYGPNFMTPFVEHGRLPGFHVTGDWPSAGYQAYYPSVGVRVDSEYFRTNVRTSIRLLQTLSTEDLTKYAPDWGIVRANIDSLTAANFQSGVNATTAKAEFLTQFDAIFALVRKGDYAGASLQLPALRTKLQTQVLAAAATNPLANIDRVIALAAKGANLPPSKRCSIEPGTASPRQSPFFQGPSWQSSWHAFTSDFLRFDWPPLPSCSPRFASLARRARSRSRMRGCAHRRTAARQRSVS